MALASVVSVLAGMALLGAIERYHAGVQPAHAASSAAPSVTSQGLPDFISLAKKLGPSVVNVSTTQMRKPTQGGPGFGDDQMGEFFERFFGAPVPRGPQRRSGLGSGFIIDSNGTILTNYHVVDGAEKISVTLSDGNSYDAKVIGKDQKSDIAVVKIDAGRDLPAVNLGDSDRLEVGEWVMAIGNPFGLDHSVTSGIVSAKGRNIGAGPYDNFIQTDASINPGNSGGPLINLKGEVVGVNTAIVAAGQGIGFAIPINMVKRVVDQLVEKGKVVRGWLGVALQPLSKELVQTLGLPGADGALVSSTIPDSPAAKAGLQQGDVVLSYDKTPVEDSHHLQRLVAETRVGKTVTLEVWRKKQKVTVATTVAEVPEDRTRPDRPPKSN
jgi:serine protease Do